MARLPWGGSVSVSPSTSVLGFFLPRAPPEPCPGHPAPAQPGWTHSALAGPRAALVWPTLPAPMSAFGHHPPPPLGWAQLPILGARKALLFPGNLARGGSTLAAVLASALLPALSFSRFPWLMLAT